MNLVAIDEHSRPDHPYLREDDDCYYIREYAPRQGPNYSISNQLILNLKKSVDRKGKKDYKYKALAIKQAGDELRSVLNPEWLTEATLVPIPCSKTQDHPLYDDRIELLVRRMVHGMRADVRNLIIQNCSLECFHGGSRLPPHQLARHYSLDPKLYCQKPVSIGLVDDVLTTGSHFKAAKQLILQQWPDVGVVGVFVARVYRVDEDNLLI